MPTQYVAPYTGAWIEIGPLPDRCPIPESLPTRERGLKSLLVSPLCLTTIVAPYTGAWIEMQLNDVLHQQ